MSETFDAYVLEEQGPAVLRRLSVALLAGLGYEVHAATGRAALHGYLRELGATAFVDRAELAETTTVLPHILRGVSLLGVDSILAGQVRGRVVIEIGR